DGMPAGDDGKQRTLVVTTEVVSIDEKPLPADQFQPPKGYRQVTSDSMGMTAVPLMGLPIGGRGLGGNAPRSR
ncbi:MAG: hypothetical protein ACOVT5_09695, partial [Armatimonadaceae bacterium]